MGHAVLAPGSLTANRPITHGLPGWRKSVFAPSAKNIQKGVLMLPDWACSHEKNAASGEVVLSECCRKTDMGSSNAFYGTRWVLALLACVQLRHEINVHVFCFGARLHAC